MVPYVPKLAGRSFVSPFIKQVAGYIAHCSLSINFIVYYISTLMAQERQIQEERGLLWEISQGDELAFAQLFDQYKHKVYAFAMHYTGRMDISEELVQEVFMKVWLHRQGLPGIARFEAWLFVICRNLSFNYLRKMAREETFKRGLAGADEAAPGTADELLLSKEYGTFLKAAVDRLPPRQKLIYNLYREQHLTHEDIAGRLGLARATVKSHLALALRSVRTYVQACIEPVIPLILWLFCR